MKTSSPIGHPPSEAFISNSRDRLNSMYWLVTATSLGSGILGIMSCTASLLLAISTTAMMSVGLVFLITALAGKCIGVDLKKQLEDLSPSSIQFVTDEIVERIYATHRPTVAQHLQHYAQAALDMRGYLITAEVKIILGDGKIPA